MKLSMRVAAIPLCLLMAAAFARAQDQPKASDDHSSDQAKAPDQQTKSHVRLDFLFTEYNGDKKISSLPYTLYVEAASRSPHPGRLRIRDNVHFQLETDVDCFVFADEDGLYELELDVNQFSVYPATEGQSEAAAIPNANNLPVNRTFSASSSMELHDGQTIEGISATDPYNGHVLRISATLHVLK
jgi:hypothetical protein